MSKSSRTKITSEVSKNDTKKRVVAIYSKLSAKRGIHPSLTDMLEAGVTRNVIRHHFGSITALGQAAKSADPKAFAGTMDGEVLSSRRFATIKRDVAQRQRFVVTTAVTGAPVHRGFYDALKNYCEATGARLLILPSMDPAAIVTTRQFVDPLLKEEHLVFKDLPLNANLFLSSIKLSAKHIDPITGLGRMGQRDGSFIYASPKQRLKMVPTSNVGLPHALMTTGAITVPAYDSERYMSHRTAYIADYDHVVGAIVVEVENNRFFHFRQVQADPDGAFIDLSTRYHPTGRREPVRPEALVLGDWHSEQNDPVARAAFIEGPGSVCKVLRPRTLIVHDGFDGISINPHECHDALLRARRYSQNLLDLEAACRLYASDLDMMARHVEEVVVVKSNHDEFLHRYIADGRYLKDPMNHGTAVRIAAAIAAGAPNAVQAAVEMFGLKNKDAITWLEYDDDYRVAGIQCGAHGHKGPNGARGSLRGMEAAYGASVTGHAHTPEILRRAFQTGTCSFLKQDYNKGPSSWMTTSCTIYDDGARQLLNVIDGKWHLGG